MKTFKFWWLALVTIVMSASFTSCSKENPEGNEDFSNEKKLVKLASAGLVSVTFTYDEKGRMVKADEVSNYSDSESFMWGDDAIKCENATIVLENGLVQRENLKWTKYVYFYNQSNRLIEYEREGSTDEISFIWDGDKLVSITEIENPNSDYTSTTDITITYEKSCKRGYNPYFIGSLGIGASTYLSFGHPELWGLRTKQLPKTVTRTRTSRYDTISETTNFSYEFDKDGYISKMIIEETYEGESSRATFTLTWE